jgi:hypothetical protein
MLATDPRTRSKTDLIVSLARARMDPAAIAGMIGSTPGAVRARISQLRRAGMKLPSSSIAPVDLRLGPPLAGVLTDAAAARGISAADLAHQILAAVLTDDLVDAVLDRGGNP